jgi:plastocyanin
MRFRSRIHARVLALGFALLFAATSHAAEAAEAGSGSVASDPASEEVFVDIRSRHFEPAVVFIRPGVKVTWFSGGHTPHGVRGDNFDLRSPPLRLGKKFSMVFSDPGVYEYFCPVHTAHRGRIVVAD